MPLTTRSTSVYDTLPIQTPSLPLPRSIPSNNNHTNNDNTLSRSSTFSSQPNYNTLPTQEMDESIHPVQSRRVRFSIDQLSDSSSPLILSPMIPLSSSPPIHDTDRNNQIENGVNESNFSRLNQGNQNQTRRQQSARTIHPLSFLSNDTEGNVRIRSLSDDIEMGTR